jgi:subtilisin family serine protease
MRTRVLLAGGLLLVLLAATLSSGAAARSTGRTATAGSATIDLATYNADRWIVQLAGKPLARYPKVKRGITFAGVQQPAKIDLQSAFNRRYLNRLARSQTAFAAKIRQAARGARVERRFSVTLNGMVVRMSKAQAAKVRRMKGVVAVTPDIPYQLNMYATPAQINAPALWAQVGGQANAGKGIKVAIIDSGIYVTKDAAGSYAGNPCFDDTGYTRPRGYPKGDTRFTNNKVIVARAYFRPDDPPTTGNDTAIQGPGASPHGTHVAGTVGCNADTPTGGDIRITGIAPKAYLMNYRIFYPSVSPDGFQNANGYVAEIVQAIEDAVRDGADVLSNSWGSSHQNTLDWPDPMVQAAEAAVDAGVVGVWAQGNSGPNQGTGNLPSASPKVISVGAVSKYATIVQAQARVTAPTPVPANLAGMDAAIANFGPPLATTGKIGPAPYITALAAQKPEVPAAQNNLGCSLAGDISPFVDGSMTGKIALIERGVCNFSEKVFNAQRSGAVGAVIHNGAANGETIAAMGTGVHGADVTIPSVLLRQSGGTAAAAYYNANPGTAQIEYLINAHASPTIGDVMAGFSSRGPTQDKSVKPDVVAPGQDVFSAGFAPGAFPANVLGFGSASGTSMATPHVAGAAALLLQLHPWWSPAMVKSALMSTATEEVFTNTAKTNRAGVLDRGAGRIDLAQAGDPGLYLSRPSLSGGEMSAGQSKTFTVRAWNIGGTKDTWDITTTETGTATDQFDITADRTEITLKPWRVAKIPVNLDALATAPPGNYEGSVVLVSRSSGKRLHIPVWLRVVPPKSVDVLLVDADGSPTGGRVDYRATYTNMLDALGVTYETTFPTAAVDLQKYRAIVVFTGDNASLGAGGFSLARQDAVSEYLDSGGRIWALGQNLAGAIDSGSFHTRLDRGRLYSGYLGLAFETDSTYGATPAPQPTATGVGPFAGLTLGLTQASIEASSSPPFNTDTYNARGTTSDLFRPIGGLAPAGSALAHSRSSEPSLEEERQEYLYRGVSMGFGLEGVASGATPAQLGDLTLDWLLDAVSVDLASSTGHDKKKVTFTASPHSSVGAAFTKYRWDFDDGSHIVTTTSPTVTHTYRRTDTYVVRVEATDGLGHRAIGADGVRIKKQKKHHGHGHGHR